MKTGRTRPRGRTPRKSAALDTNCIIRECETGGEALLLSVIALGIRDVYVPEYRKEAIAWLLSDSQEPSSFRWYCRLLSLEPESILKIAFEKGNPL